MRAFHSAASGATRVRATNTNAAAAPGQANSSTRRSPLATATTSPTRVKRRYGRISLGSSRL